MANNSLRSFASGMIIATSIFTAVYYFQPTRDETDTAGEHTLTAAEVEHYLNEKDYISITKQEYDDLVNNQRPIEDSTETEENNKELDVQEDTNDAEIIEQNDPVNEQPPTEHKETDITQDEQQARTFTLEIKQGMNSIQIANILEGAEIVKSSKEFEQFLISKNWNRSIQIGTYKLNSTMSYEEIGRILTKK